MSDPGRECLDYSSTLAAFAGGRLVLAFVLMLVMALSAGLGLLMLVPLLGLVGLDDGELDVNRFESVIVAGFGSLGIPFTLPAVLLVFLLLIVVHSLASRYTDLLTTAIQLEFDDYLRNRLYRAVALADWTCLSRMRQADVTHALTHDVDRVGNGNYYLLRAATTSTLAGVYTIVAFGLDWTLSAVVLLTAGALILSLRPLTGKALDLGETLTQSSTEVYRAIAEHMSGMKVIKAFGAEARHVRRFEKYTADQRSRQFAFMRNHTSVRLWFRLGAALALASFVYVAVEALNMPAPELLVLIFVFSRIMPMFSELHGSYQQVLHMLPAWNGLEKMRSRCERAAEDAGNPNAVPLSFEREIRFRDVHFRYLPEVSDGQDTLSRIEVGFPSRTTTAIVGPSGSGKTTLADLLMGLLSAYRGEILIDNTLLDEKNRHAWREQIAYVPQETFLFHDTIRENLSWTDPQADDATLWNALSTAAASDFVLALPEGLDTVVGERGTRLSGGERQRIALARALLRRPPLLVLDEATSALDSEHERRIHQAIEQLHGTLTLVIIAHRMSTACHADRVIVLERGTVVESGDRELLSRKHGGHLSRWMRADSVE